MSAEGQPSRAEPGSEDDIVIDLKAGHAAATERFVREHIGWMLAVANRILRDSHHAEDAVQNAFAKIFDKLSSFDGRAAVKTWMHRILVNECLMLMRKPDAWKPCRSMTCCPSSMPTDAASRSAG